MNRQRHRPRPGEGPGDEQFHPAEHEGEEQGHPDSCSNHGDEHGEEEPTEGIPINFGHFIELFGYPGHESFQNPHRQGHVEQHVREGNSVGGVKQAHRLIHLEERQQEHRCRCHAVGEQPEEQVLVTGEREPAKRVSSRQCDGDRQHHVHRRVGQGVQQRPVPQRVGEELNVTAE